MKIALRSCVAFPPRPLGTGMHFQTLLSPLLKLPRMLLLSSLLWWELGTSLPGPGPGERLSFWRVTSKHFWFWFCPNLDGLSGIRPGGSGFSQILWSDGLQLFNVINGHRIALCVLHPFLQLLLYLVFQGKELERFVFVFFLRGWGWGGDGQQSSRFLQQKIHFCCSYPSLDTALGHFWPSWQVWVWHIRYLEKKTRKRLQYKSLTN